MTIYIAKQWDIDRLEYLEERIREYTRFGDSGRKYEDRPELIAFDLRAEIQKLKRQAIDE